MKLEQAVVGQRVRSLLEFSGVPKGTEGIIDEDYGTGVMVAWNLPNMPLPPEYTRFDPDLAMNERPYLLRDGFNKRDDLEYLEILTGERG